MFWLCFFFFNFALQRSIGHFYQFKLTVQSETSHLFPGREHKTKDSARSIQGGMLLKRETERGEWKTEKWEQTQLEPYPYL